MNNFPPPSEHLPCLVRCVVSFFLRFRRRTSPVPSILFLLSSSKRASASTRAASVLAVLHHTIAQVVLKPSVFLIDSELRAYAHHGSS
jgi:hypothetical protein